MPSITPYLEQSTVYNQLNLDVPLYCPPSFPPSFVHPDNVRTEIRPTERLVEILGTLRPRTKVAESGEHADDHAVEALARTIAALPDREILVVSRISWYTAGWAQWYYYNARLRTSPPPQATPVVLSIAKEITVA